MRNIVLVVLGVGFLLWLSTFGDNEIRSKMEFYSNGAGSFVGWALLFVPVVIAAQWCSSRGADREPRTGKAMIWAGVIAFSCQLVIAAFVPNIVSLYKDAGGYVSEGVIQLKKAG